MHTSKIVTEAYQVKRISFHPPSKWLCMFLYGDGTSYFCVYIVSFGQRYSLGRLPRVPVSTELTVCLAFEMPPQISTVRIPWLKPRWLCACLCLYLKMRCFSLCFKMIFDVKLCLLIYRPSTNPFIMTVGHDSVHIM